MKVIFRVIDVSSGERSYAVKSASIESHSIPELKWKVLSLPCVGISGFGADLQVVDDDGVANSSWAAASDHIEKSVLASHPRQSHEVIYVLKQVKPGFTTYQPQPKYSLALSKIEGKGKSIKT